MIKIIFALCFATVLSAPHNVLKYQDFDGTTRLIPLDQKIDFDNVTLREVQDRVRILLFTLKNPTFAVELTEDNIADTPYNPKNPTKLITHGWIEHGKIKWIQDIKNKFMMQGDFNIIALDWSFYSQLEYTMSASATKKVGEYVGNVISALVQKYKANPSKFHLAGHSLGSHVCGFIGKTVYENTGKKIGRITGLDPAGPLFEMPFLVEESKRLCRNDAEFVDVLHTCGGVLGFSKDIGHADFYPNDGTPNQPGCVILVGQVCSHSRAYEFFEESVTSSKFLSLRCDTWKQYKKGKCNGNEVVSMGVPVSTSARGIFYLRTSKNEPFAKNYPFYK